MASSLPKAYEAASRTSFSGSFVALVRASRAGAADLAELVPGYLSTVPADPFGGGEPLRYKRVENSYLLWSIGPDGVDDGGKPVTGPVRAARFPADKPRLPFLSADSKGDYVAGWNR